MKYFKDIEIEESSIYSDIVTKYIMYIILIIITTEIVLLIMLIIVMVL